MCGRHAHVRVHWWRRCWSIWSAGGTRVILATTPREANSRVADWVALHLVDGHLSSMALDELDKAATLARRDFHIGDLAKALEKRPQLVLSNVTGKTSNKDCGVVGVCELVHGLWSTVVAHWWSVHAVHAHVWAIVHTHRCRSARAAALILRSSSGDAHWTITAIHTLHLCKSTLLLVLASEANEAIAT